MLAVRLTRVLLGRFSTSLTRNDPLGTALVGPNTRKGTKRVDRELRELKHSLANKEPVRNEALYEVGAG